jgi:HEAT repeat protein
MARNEVAGQGCGEPDKSASRTYSSAFGVMAVLVAILVGALCFSSRSPAPLPGPLRKPVHDLRAEVPFYYAWINRLFATGRASWMPGRLVSLAGTEADRVSERRAQATWKLGEMGTNVWPAIPVLLKTLENRDLPIRYSAAAVLSRIRADQAPGFEQLKLRLRNKERPADALNYLLTGRDEFGRWHGLEVRCFALAGLAALGPGARSRLGTVLEILKSKDDDHEMRAKALEVIRSIGSIGNAGVSLLKQVFQDREEWPDVRAAAARALAGVAPSDTQLPPLLRQALGASPGLVRVAAAETLWQLGAPTAEVLPVLTGALGHKLATVRVGALKAVAGMGKTAQPAATAVRGLLSDENEPVRRAATVAQASMGLEKDQDAKGDVMFQVEGCVHYYNHWGEEHLKDPRIPFTPTVSNSFNFSLAVSNSCYLLRTTPAKAGAYSCQEAAFDGQTVYYVTKLNLADVQGTPPPGVKLNVATAWMYDHQRLVHSLFAHEMEPIWLMFASDGYFRTVTNGLVEPALTLGLFENADYYPRPFVIPARWELQEAFPFLPLRVTYLDDGETKTEPPFQNARRDPPFDAGFTNVVFRVTATRKFGEATVPVTGEVDTYNLTWSQGKQELRRYAHYQVAVTKWSKGIPPTIFRPKLPGPTTISDKRSVQSEQRQSGRASEWPE